MRKNKRAEAYFTLFFMSAKLFPLATSCFHTYEDEKYPIFHFSWESWYIMSMNARTKKTYRQWFKEVFYRIKIHPIYQKTILLPFSLRLVLSTLLFLFGIVGLLTPIPAGWVMIGISAILIFGLRLVRRHSLRIFFLLRLHKVWEWVKYKRWW